MKTGKWIIMFVLAAALIVLACSCSFGGATGGVNKEEAVKTAVAAYLKSGNADITDVNVTDVKIYTENDLEPVVIEDYAPGKDDIIFSVTYDVTVADGVDANIVAIPDGEVDGQTVKGQNRVGIIRYADGKYSVDPNFFGTGF